MLNRKILAVAIAAVAAATLSTGALAATPWQRHHPARAEINHRLVHQDQRIHHEVRTGEITRAQAARLHRADHRIRHEERVMASRHHGHLTRAQVHALNRQENAVSRRISR